MVNAIDVGPAEDFNEGTLIVTRIEGREVVLTRWRGEIFAVRNVCPHQSQPLKGGTIYSDFVGTPGAFEADPNNPVIVCPFHKWRFSLRSGGCVTEARLRVRSYPVEIVDGRVLVDIAGKRTSTPPDHRISAEAAPAAG